MANEKVRAVYKCQECSACFEHEDVGERVYNICINGGGTYSRRLTVQEIEDQNDRGNRYSEGKSRGSYS